MHRGIVPYDLKKGFNTNIVISGKFGKNSAQIYIQLNWAVRMLADYRNPAENPGACPSRHTVIIHL
jgi:hypothetical protein